VAQVERVGERGPARPARLGPAIRDLDPRGKRDDRLGRGNQQVEGLVEGAHRDAELGALAQRPHVAERRVSQALGRRLGQAGVDQVPAVGRDVVDDRGRTRAPDHVEGGDRAGEPRVGDGDPRAAALERRDRAPDGRCDLGVDLRVSERGAVSHAQPPDPGGRDLAGDRGAALQRERVPGVGGPDDIQQHRRVGHGPGHRPDVGERAERARREHGNPAVGRLEAHDAAEARRDPDRPGAVGAHGQRCQARGHGSRGASAGPARRAAQIPGVARHPGERAVGHGLPAPLRRGGLAEQHGPVLTQPGHGRRVHRPRAGGVDGPRAPQRRPSAGQQQVLDRGWHAVQQSGWLPSGPSPFRCPGRGQRLVAADEAVGVDRRVRPVDLREHGLRRLHGRQLTPPV
jgi:hypothetical protein